MKCTKQSLRAYARQSSFKSLREDAKARSNCIINFVLSKFCVFRLDCFVVLLLAMTIGFSAYAQEKPAEVTKKEEPAKGLFFPDFCDFEMTFPEAPLTSERCLPSGQCYTLQSYTMVYDLHTTVDISVNCTPSTPASFAQYTKGVMKAALAGMIEERNLDAHDINYTVDEKTKSASLTGTGKTGAQDKIYTAQMWIGQNSVFTVQAELIGGAHDVADKSFGDILKSLKTKEGKQVTQEKKVPIVNQAKNQ